MTKTYCTAAVCYKSNITARGAKRDCTHPEGPGKLESPRTPSTCPLTIKYKLTEENSIILFPPQPLGTIRLSSEDIQSAPPVYFHQPKNAKPIGFTKKTKDGVIFYPYPKND